MLKVDEQIRTANWLSIALTSHSDSKL